MATKNDLVLEDFTSVTDHIHRALESINTIYKSSSLTEKQKSEVGRLGRLLHQTGHDMGHVFMTLDSLPDQLKEKLHEHYGH
ncbi:MAG: hypothetical protein PVG85_03995 [Deltaproteobacteria bacterium]|jgi:hypothetical protein